MHNDPTYYRRNLPHYQPACATYFVTFRLKGSLPKDVSATLRQEYRLAEAQLRRTNKGKERLQQELSDLRKRAFARYDEYLDRGSCGPDWLGDDRVAGIVAQSVHILHGKQYD